MYASIGVTLGLALVPGILQPYWRFADDSHMHFSLEHAFSAANCGTLKTSAVFDLPGHVARTPGELTMPLRTVVESHFGSMSDFCATLRIPRIDNEPSLMWIMRAIFAVSPRASAADIGRTMSAIRVLILALFCFALSRAGASLWLIGAVAVAACGVLRALGPYQYNNNPFIFSLTLLLIGLYVLLLASSRRPGSGAGIVVFAGLGALTAFAANMRTSHIPIYLTLFAAFVVAWRRPRGGWGRPTSSRTVVAVVTFVAAGWATHWALVTPMQRLGGSGITHHVVAHQLVLALAVPENDLSRRERLAWDDAVGFDLARRLNPGVEPLTPAYESTLFRYYFGLWRDHPTEMVGLYWRKLNRAGSGVLDEIAHLLENRGLPLRAGRWLAGLRVAGLVYLLLSVGTAVGGWQAFTRRESVLGFAALLISIAALGTVLESALIMSDFYVFYHSLLLFYLLVAPAAVIQLAADRWHRVPA